MTRGRRRRRQSEFDQLIGWMVILGMIAMLFSVVVAAVAAVSPETKTRVGVVALALLALWVVYRVSQGIKQARRKSAYAQWQAVRDRHLVTADVMTGAQFEQLVRRLLDRDGLSDTRVAGGSGDRGADVFGRTAEGHHVVVQCKRYAVGRRKVTSPEMQLFVGMAWNEHHADRPLYVTTSDFTPEAERLARKHGVYLIGRAELAQWMSGAPVFNAAIPPSGGRSQARKPVRRRRP